ncbi:MAG: hypothetical protein GWN00_01530 [Aliifodinibius sp.]|nr:hypothetical protein [Phycisphaerae bacterium]NIR62359.1 hypothetical protein [candidate division Zixibacteria bacterium]NIT54959.1 hypothetical protein [Fodinibius sp.]NIW43370.1 hypothetical protein [Gammaproteobacteria bacterium]NIU12592.1 hypothetical protein [candidate division Zixibacteria bacterium]
MNILTPEYSDAILNKMAKYTSNGIAIVEAYESTDNTGEFDPLALITSVQTTKTVEDIMDEVTAQVEEEKALAARNAEIEELTKEYARVKNNPPKHTTKSVWVGSGFQAKKVSVYTVNVRKWERKLAAIREDLEAL